jgi:hypothetical protein
VFQIARSKAPKINSSPTAKPIKVGSETPASGRALPPGVGETADISPPVVGVGVEVCVAVAVGVGVDVGLVPPIGLSVGVGD